MMVHFVSKLRLILPHWLAATAVSDYINTSEIIIDLIVLMYYCFQTSMIYDKEQNMVDSTECYSHSNVDRIHCLFIFHFLHLF